MQSGVGTAAAMFCAAVNVKMMRASVPVLARFGMPKPLLQGPLRRRNERGPRGGVAHPQKLTLILPLKTENYFGYHALPNVAIGVYVPVHGQEIF